MAKKEVEERELTGGEIVVAAIILIWLSMCLEMLPKYVG